MTSAAADACDEGVRALERGGTAEGLAKLTDTRAAAAATAFAPTRRRHALIMMIDELRTFGTLLPESDTGRADASAHMTLRMNVQEVLSGCARALRGDGLPDVEGLDRARAQHRFDLERWAHDSLLRGEPADWVLDGMDGERNLRLLSHVALGVATATTTVCGAQAPAHWRDLAPMGASPGGAPAARRTWQTIRSHVTISSVRFRDALRAGSAVGLAVFVAGIGDFRHGFWVALGALAVLRTSVIAGERSAVAAVGGTAAGFLAVIPILWVIGSAGAVPWIVLPLLVFVAAYASGALPLAVGQATFTAFVVLAVDMIEPDGWRTGEIRLVDVITGASVALVVGALFWPRGAQTQLRASLAELYRDDGHAADVGVWRRVGHGVGLRRVRRRALGPHCLWSSTGERLRPRRGARPRQRRGHVVGRSRRDGRTAASRGRTDHARRTPQWRGTRDRRDGHRCGRPPLRRRGRGHSRRTESLSGARDRCGSSSPRRNPRAARVRR